LCGLTYVDGYFVNMYRASDSAGPGEVARMGSSVDHMHVCADGQRLVVSDRAGAIDVLDFRRPGAPTYGSRRPFLVIHRGSWL
jgi:hypothetical protein